MREGQRLSQERLSELTAHQPWKISRPVISAIERGEHLPSFEALMGLSKVLHFDPMEVLERAEMAAAAPTDLTDCSLDDLRAQARDMALSGAYREALGLYDAMLQRLVLDPPPEADATRRLNAEVEMLRAGALFRCGALNSSEAATKRAIVLAQGDPGRQSLAYALLSKVEITRGFMPLAMDHAERAVALAEACGPKERGRARLELGQVQFAADRFEEARRTFVEARTAIHEGEDRAHYSHVDGNVGLCDMALGEREKARVWFRRALDHARDSAMPILEARWLTELGRLAYLDDRLDEADRYGIAAVTLARPRESWMAWFRAEWLRFQVAGKKDATGSQRQRRATLRKLLVHVADYTAENEVREYRAFVDREANAGSGRRHS